MGHKKKAKRKRHNADVSSAHATEPIPAEHAEKPDHHLQCNDGTTMKKWPWQNLIQFGILAVGAIYAGLTYGLWDTSQKTLQASARAWLEVRINPSSSNPPLSEMEKLAFKREIINSGHSPARNIHAQTGVELVPRTMRPSMDYPGIMLGHDCGDVLFPNAAQPCPLDLVWLNDQKQPRILTPEERAELTDGRLYYVAYARVQYEDDFGAHWTHACWWSSLNGGKVAAIQPCVLYNNVGDGPEPYLPKPEPVQHFQPEQQKQESHQPP